MELQCNLTAAQQAVYAASVNIWWSLRQGLVMCHRLVSDTDTQQGCGTSLSSM